MADSIANRLGILESQIDFLMKNMRMRAMIQTGLLNAKGEPEVKVIEGSLYDHWKLHASNTVPPDAPDLPSDPPRLPPSEVN